MRSWIRARADFLLDTIRPKDKGAFKIQTKNNQPKIYT
jgi:hypothetical protein